MSEINLIGIDENGLSKLILEIYDYAEQINYNLNLIDDKIYETSQCYICESGNKFREKFIKLKENFPIVIENILRYAEDLTRVKNNTVEFNEDLSTQIGENLIEIDN